MRSTIAQMHRKALSAKGQKVMTMPSGKPGRFFVKTMKQLVHRGNIRGESVVNNSLGDHRSGIDFIGPFQLFTRCSPGVFGG